MMAVPMQAGEGGFKLGDFRSKLLRRAHTQAAQEEITLSRVDATMSSEKLWTQQPPKGKPFTPFSECKGSQPEAFEAPNAAREKSEFKGVPAVPPRHAAAFKERRPLKQEST